MACALAEAAVFLGLTRTQLDMLIGKGALPVRDVDGERCIRIEDMLKFAATRARDRRELAERFAHMTEDNDLAIEETL